MRYYFLGIGGIGMSALARFFKQRGDEVCGYDRTPSPLIDQLVAERIPVHFDDDPKQVPWQPDLVVYTPAVPADTQLFQYLQQQGVPMKKRSQVLGELTQGKKCIAVAGTHGKTTTSSMIAHLLNMSGIGCSAFLGGICKNLDSNMVVNNDSEYVVVEADEYDRSFLQLHPYYSVITATDPDHLDIYGTHDHLLEAFAQYANQTNPEGRLFLKQGTFRNSSFADPEPEEHCHEHEHEDEHEHEHARRGSLKYPIGREIQISSYTAHGIEADYYPWNVRCYNGDIFFDLRTPKGVYYDMQLHDSSLYNVENAVVAAAVAQSCGLDEGQLRAGLKSFAGVRRRFDYRIHTKDLVYIDDYAHHPNEIAATLESIRTLFPGKRVVGIFQPHLYSRTRDFADPFAQVLSTLDEIILMPIYPAREQPIVGISSHTILRKINTMSKYLCLPNQVLELVPALYPDVLVTMGAGDIDRLVPKLEALLS